MPNTKFDVLGIGNAIVDVLAKTDDVFLTKHNLPKGGMILIDADQANALYGEMGPAQETSGGSAANTIAGIAALGGSTAFIGKIADDDLGEIFAHDIKAQGVNFETPHCNSGTPTARCFVLVTPDAERTMNTFLGACQNLGPDDVTEDQISSAKVVYLEGYLWDPPQAKKAFLKAMEIAHSAGRKVALSLSDSFCVGRYREEFLNLVENHVDILFANEDEIKALYQTNDFNEAVHQVRTHVEVAALTRGADGATIVKGLSEVHVDADPVELEDTTGAGDLYAAGFLYGYTRGMDMEKCGQIAAMCAAEIISHVGARPEANLKELLEKRFG
jgi:sugar/nucleoside kinase (ribokinase family)